MVLILIIFLLALLPSLLSLWQLRQLNRQLERQPWSQGRGWPEPSDRSAGRASDRSYPWVPPPRFQQARQPNYLPGVRRRDSAMSELRYVDGVGYFLGDLSCEFNARSPHIRCAVNPLGPCKGCSAYRAVAAEAKLPPARPWP